MLLGKNKNNDHGVLSGKKLIQALLERLLFHEPEWRDIIQYPDHIVTIKKKLHFRKQQNQP